MGEQFKSSKSVNFQRYQNKVFKRTKKLETRDVWELRKFTFEYNLSAYPGVKNTFYCLDILLSNVFNKNSIDQAKCLFIIKLIPSYYNLCFSGFQIQWHIICNFRIKRDVPHG